MPGASTLGLGSLRLPAPFSRSPHKRNPSGLLDARDGYDKLSTRRKVELAFSRRACTYWVVDEIVRDANVTDHLRTKKQPRKPASIHPYASGPINWPFLLSGISFWTGKNDERQQVYLIGNVVGWWICVMALSVFVGVLGADQLAKRRGLTPIPAPVRDRLYNSGGFFLLAWLYHYLPFFTMSRQLFLHHYLPAHVLSAFVAGAVFHFLFCGDTVNYPVSVASATTRRRPRQRAEVGTGLWIALAVVVAALLANFVFLAPLTYGAPGLTPEEVNRRRILSSWTLHFAK
ncbi:hypothetical protein JCM1840_006656 [Sporobolomyces johnsonii]